MNIQRLVLTNLIKSEAYTRKVITYLKKEYFGINEPDRVVFEIVQSYFEKYNRLPPIEALAIEVQNRRDLSEDLFEKTLTLFGDVVEGTEEFPDQPWLIDQTEDFCKNKALHLALTKAIEIVADENGRANISKGEIPKLMQDALAVSFDSSIGHDYIDDAAARWDYQHKPTRRLPFALEMFNKITGGGVYGKTLNVVMAVSNAGKSLMLVDFAANYLMQGKNVLYISMEMSEEQVSNRIDANLMNISLSEMEAIPRDIFLKKIARIREKTPGRLKVKEYGPQTAGAAQFRKLIYDLKTKKGFVPDVVMIDYLNICAATTLGKGEHNSNTRITRVCEENRALAIELDIPFWSATQTNRQGYGEASASADKVSDAIGIVQTCDFLISLGDNEQLRELGQYQIRQLKSRYGNKDFHNQFFIGVNKTKQKLYDLDNVDNDPRTSDAGEQTMAMRMRPDVKTMRFDGFR